MSIAPKGLVHSGVCVASLPQSPGQEIPPSQPGCPAGDPAALTHD
jgi:hypothetical protein